MNIHQEEDGEEKVGNRKLLLLLALPEKSTTDIVGLSFSLPMCKSEGGHGGS